MTQPDINVAEELSAILARIRQQDTIAAAVSTSDFLEWIQAHHAYIGELRRMYVAKAAETMKHSEVAAGMNARVTTVRRLIAESRQARREDE